MAFAQQRSAASTFLAGTNPAPVNLPTTVVAGDLLLLLIAYDQNVTITVDSVAHGAWTELFMDNTSNGNITTYGFVKVASGTEGGSTVDITTSLQRAGSTAYCVAFQDWFGTLAGVESSTPVFANNSNPDPGALTPSWGAEDTVWVAHSSSDSNDAITGYPTDYDDNQFTLTGGAGGATTGYATRELNAVTEDPGSFTLAGSEQWLATTIGIRPAAAAGGPVITAGETDQITETTARGNVSTDTVAGTMWGGVWPSASTPSIADIKAGTGAVAGTASSQAVTGANLTFSVTGLDEAVSYNFHFVQNDGSDDSNQDSDAFVTSSVAPTIVADPTSSITDTTATGNVTTNEQRGTMWAGVWPSGSTPSAADIKAGTGAVAGTASSQAVSSGSLTFPVTGLSDETDYLFFFVQEDLVPNQSNVDSDAFTTLQTQKFANVQLADINGTNRSNQTGIDWAWYDAVPATGVNPLETGTGGTTDANGNFQANISKSNLDIGQDGYLLISVPSQGWTGIYSVTVAAS